VYITSGLFRILHQFKGVIVGKLEGKVAVITGASTGMALAGAKLFVDEGAYVFITGRRQEALDEVTIWWRPLPSAVEMQGHLAHVLGMQPWELRTNAE
jgi:NAD(P)-dependent dehydrogenase (short-subunit alcohol dehydrogenase family)